MTSAARIPSGLIITRSDLERIAGTRACGVDDGTLDLAGLRYRVLSSAERKAVLRDVDHDLDTRSYRRSGENAPEVWQRGWSDVAARLKTRLPSVETLRPQYYRDERIFRFDGQIVEGLGPFVEFNISMALRRLLFAHYIADAETVVELGCGTGLNVLLLAQAYPRMRIVGCDWVPASQEIVEALGREFPGRITAQRFDMLTAQGWDGNEIGASSVVLTVDSLEQLYIHWQTCLDFILARAPGFCLHIEPLAELYDEADPDDARMLRYHRKRCYLEGFVPAVQALAAEGRAEILDLRRIAFCGLHHEGYSVLAWRPIN